jgi:aminoglycoside 3-N-acetyltransferase
MIVQTAVDGLRSLGLTNGDVVLVRAAARSLTPDRTHGSPAGVLLKAIREAIGPRGTIVALAFSRQNPAWKKPRDYTFTRSARTNAGAVPQIMLDCASAVRSAHPVNSFVADGPLAHRIVHSHGPQSTCFHPMRALIDLNAKMLLVGCVASSPGFSTVHLAQEDLGLAVKSLLSGLAGAYYYENGGRRWFSRRDIPGCSMGFAKAYPAYGAALKTGFVVEARSALIDAAAAYAVERRMLEQDPTSLLCDNPGCLWCGTRTYALSRWPRFFLNAPGAARKASARLRAQSA